MAELPQRLRRVLVDASAAAWSLGPGRTAGDRHASDAELRLLHDALQAAQAERFAAIGPWADRVSGATADAGPDTPIVLAGVLERTPAHRIPALMHRLRDRPLIVATLPLWPAGRAAGGRTLRSRAWWDAQAGAVGLEQALELRRAADGIEALVLAPRETTPAAGSRRVGAPARKDVSVRINDPLHLGNSFAWISASIAIALDDLGVPVSIAPTTLSASFDEERRERLSRLLENGRPPGTADVEVGWTHFWPEYRRELGGRLPLRLFAINYAFRKADPAGFDPWFGSLVRSGVPVAPISAFCREVLVDAGLPAELAHVVPMGYTDGVERAVARPLPDARGLKVLHVTNAADVARNGTDLALAAFAEAFEPDDDVTLVVRDYGSCAPALIAQVQALAARGYDARYWPVFLAQARLGSLLGAFDVLLAPFRGEGFGVKVLDAMACGAMPIIPAFGGPRDFADGEVALEVAHDLVPVEAGYDADNVALGNEPVWARCRHDDLVAALRTARDDRPAVERRGTAARERALARFSWHDTARRITELI